MTCSQIFPPLSPFAPFYLREYIRRHMPCLDVYRFQAMPIDGERKWVYDTRNGDDRLPSVGGCVKRSKNKGGCGAVLCRDVETYVKIPFIRCTGEKAYASLLALIVHNGSELTNAVPVAHRSEYVAFPRL